MGDSNAVRIASASTGANRDAACVGWGSSKIADRFISGGTAFEDFKNGKCK